jgi:hypothetical protein
MNAPQLSFFMAFAVLCIAMNVLWYRAKFLLRARGFPVAWLPLESFEPLLHADSDATRKT